MLSLAEVEAQPRLRPGERQDQVGAEAYVAELENPDRQWRQSECVADVDTSLGNLQRGRVGETAGRDEIFERVEETENPVELHGIVVRDKLDREVRFLSGLGVKGHRLEMDFYDIGGAGWQQEGEVGQRGIGNRP